MMTETKENIMIQCTKSFELYHLNVCVNVSEDVVVKGHCLGTALHVIEQHVKD